MKISINTGCLLGNMPYADAFALISEYEYHVFEAWRIPENEVAPLQRDMRAYSMTLSAICADEFTLNDPNGHAAYEAGIITAISKAKRLGCKKLITQVGQATSAPRREQHDAIVAGIRRVLPLLEEAGIMLLIEPLNDVKDHKGYYLTHSAEGFEIIREVGSDNVKLLFDIYHQVHMGEDVMSIIKDNIGDIAHFHVAGHPRRDAEIFENFDYRPVFRLIDELGYDEYVGLELNPSSEERARKLLCELQEFR